MTAPARGALWFGSAALLLVLGFLAVVYAGALSLELRGGSESVGEAQSALVIYARMVLLKGLLPQLLLALLLWSVLDRRFGFRRRGRLGLALGVTLCALLAGAVVAPLLLPLHLPPLARVKFTGPGNVVATVLEMTAAVASALLLPQLVLPALRRD